MHMGMDHVSPGLKEVNFMGTPENMKERIEDTREHMSKRKHMRHEMMEKMKKDRKAVVGMYMNSNDVLKY